ncbi:MAG: patatin-like phospholipase family protein [Bacteroidota bacterium]
MPKWITDAYYSFPVQLFLLHLRSNLMLLLLWILMILLISGAIGYKLGFAFLFLDPEYLDKVNFWSFFMIGLSLGGFLMTWNLTTYLLSAHRFPFLASLEKPFTKFCVNNFIIPIAFVVYYMIAIINFQVEFENWNFGRILLVVVGFLGGNLTLFLFYLIYFHLTNRDIGYFIKLGLIPQTDESLINPGRKDVDVDYIKKDSSRQRVDYYFNEYGVRRRVRSVAHYDGRLLKRIFKQNHLNALIIQLLTMFMLFLLGSLMDYSVFRIPAAASLMIAMSLVTAIIGALTYWFSEWRTSIIIVLLIIINFATKYRNIDHTNKAFGLNYKVAPAEYSYPVLESISSDAQIKKDIIQTENILNNWKANFDTTTQKKPKLILLAVSGGGLRSAAWTVNAIQKMDSLLQGELFKNTVLITGASGGMLGASYMRELYLRKQEGEAVDLYDTEHYNNISKDLLNSIAFTLVSNDLFMPWLEFRVGDQVYRKDRGYIFEQQLNDNTGGIMDKALIDYKDDEAEGKIPMIMMSASVVNDARRLMISPQGVSYMMFSPIRRSFDGDTEIDAIDFGKLFAEQDAQNLKFLSALRMGATFPYVMPNVHLPSEPILESVDAGFIDNNGIKAATRFVQVFKDWMVENTSGVVLIQISGSPLIEPIEAKKRVGVIESVFNPIGIASQILNLQEYNDDSSLGFMYDILGRDFFSVIRITYSSARRGEKEASISFHLTDQEKINVREELSAPYNQSALRQLVRLMGAEKTMEAAQ